MSRIDPNAPSLLEFFKAMANESRLRIVGLLAEREHSGQELAARLDLKEPTISHHLAMLKRLGLVEARAEGVTRWHALNAEALTGFNRALFEPKASPTPAGPWEFDVLNSLYGDNGPLSKFPRAVILAWLTEHFETGRDYTEAEVNDILRRRHWDAANLRRELLGQGLLVRDAGVFRRPPPEETPNAVEPADPREAKVLAAYVSPDGAITQLPAARNKRLIVLKWLVARFEEGRRYPEAEVNAIIQRSHWDSATLRRELIGHRMMARESGVYWRLSPSEWLGPDAKPAIS